MDKIILKKLTCDYEKGVGYIKIQRFLGVN